MRWILTLVVVFLSLVPAGFAQSLAELRTGLEDLVLTQAVTGYEQKLAALLSARLRERGLAPRTDPMSNLTVAVGSGKPHRLIIAGMDEPGFIVSGITADGYLRIQRVGPGRPHRYFDQYFEGQRLWIQASGGTTVTGVTSIPSTHLARGTNVVEKPFEIVDAYIDIGARSEADVARLGIRVLDPVSIEKSFMGLAGDRVTGPFLADRAGAAVLMSLLLSTPQSEMKGTVTFAFASQEHFNQKGVDRLTVQYAPDEVYVLRGMSGDDATGSVTQSLGNRNGVPVDTELAPRLRRAMPSFEGIVRELDVPQAPNSPKWKDGTQVVHLGIPVMYFQTPVEILDLKDLQAAVRFLRRIVQGGVS